MSMENKNSLPLSKQHEQAVKLHNRIMASASLAQQSLWEMCIGLKQMRDGKLYRELGYSNFEDYCETEVGMKRRNVYNYISIVENVENVQSIAQIGMTKLSLLATISGEQQQEISEKVDLESTTVKELKAEIDKLKGWNKDLGAAKDKAVAAQTSLEEEVNELKGERDRANKAIEKLQSKEREITRLERENKELRNRPVDIAVIDHSAENDRKLNEVILSLERENVKRNEEMDRMYIEDRRKLEADKAAEIEAIRREYEEKLKTAQVQSGEPDKEKQEFKILLVMAHDAVKRLVSFANSHDKRIYIDKAGELLASSAAALKED